MTTERGPLPRRYVVATATIVALAALASGAGLLVPGLYRDAAVLRPQLFGQDLLTLSVAVPALAVALYYAARGSLRGRVVWLGVLGYVLYTYASYAVMTAFNPLYLVYVALFGLALFTVVGGVARLDAPGLRRRLGDRSVRPYVWFQLAAAVLVGLLWLADVGPASANGTIPAALADTGLPTPVIQSLDLGVLVPALALSAYWLRRDRAWGYAFTGVLLVKVATLALAVLAMAAFQLRDGGTVPLPMLAIFGTLSAVSLVLTARFVLAIGSEPRPGAAGTPPGTIAGGRGD